LKIVPEDIHFGMATLLTHPMSLLFYMCCKSLGNDTGVYSISRACPVGTVHFMMFARLRAYIGFLPVRRTFPNSTHYALAALQHTGVVGPLITQNVDGLHHAALRRISSKPEVDQRILELHGSIFVSPVFCSHPSSRSTQIPFLLFRREEASTDRKEQKVNCQHGHVYPRTVFQEWLGQANPRWRTFLAELERTGAQPKTNPDGDVRRPIIARLRGCQLTTFPCLGCARRERFVRRLCRSPLPQLRSRGQKG
jgi:hypothetical protein